MGNSVGIQVDRDRAILEGLPGSEVKVLAEPHREELQQFLWDERGWDILFFAGHSSSHVGGASGQIELNQTDSLTVLQLKHALRAAIARGLQLAVFNSCDGLGLARSLADLHVPQLVVMREPVPDRVAQEFLKQFLTVFARGKSFYLAVREAREKLQSLEGDYPCASWLPVICQNPATIPPTWWELSRDPFIEPLRLQRQRSLRAVLLTSALATLIAVGAQQLGWLERWELRAFDHLVQLRPAEPPDDRLLVVTVTARDVESQPIRERGDRSISDSKLEQLLTRLVSLEPRLIGLDIYRDLPASPQQPALSALLRQSDRLVTVCKTGEPDDNSSDISPAPELLDDSGVPLPGRVGFSDVVTDVDGVLRRHLLGFAPPDGSACATSISFSLLVAARYLQTEGVEVQKTPADELFLGDLRLNLLSRDVASYHNLDAMGYQILLNYRAADPIAQQYTLAEALDGTALTADKVRDRIVLIGTTDRTFHDVHATPYTTESYDRTPGVLIQAHAISQLLSAVLDDRPLLWWLPHWAEILWTGSWATVGGLLVWRWRSLIWIGLGQNVVLGVLYGSCYVFLLQGGWLPLIPPTLAFCCPLAWRSQYPYPSDGNRRSKPLCLIPHCPNFIRQTGSNFLNPLLGKFFLGSRKHCFDGIFYRNFPRHTCFLIDAKQEGIGINFQGRTDPTQERHDRVGVLPKVGNVLGKAGIVAGHCLGLQFRSHGIRSCRCHHVAHGAVDHHGDVSGIVNVRQVCPVHHPLQKRHCLRWHLPSSFRHNRCSLIKYLMLHIIPEIRIEEKSFNDTSHTIYFSNP
ncbi:MAG: CHASE2 domain-containing protein [Coleofasciculaceae cyanobacterium SM2_3_26]|nr:CHASE2 domain-containing protein [Coleofasciculaceae cyanobacterium SM2_3_26]